MRIDGATDVKWILAFFRAALPTSQAAEPDRSGYEACMAIEREYASQPYPFEWE
jgi:hypothetical protein